MNQVLRVHDLRVEYPEFTLGPVSVMVEPGERVALVGPNGAGKSTIMKTLAGLTGSYDGSVAVLGDEACRWGPKLRNHVGILHERLHGFGWMTVTEHLSLLGDVFETWDATYAEALATRLELPRRTKLANLSKGNRVKLGFVAAEAFRPELLLLDEPTSGIDPVMRRGILDLVTECATSARGRTVILSTHILEDVEEVAERVVLLRKGLIVDDVSVGDLRQGGGTSVSSEIFRRLADA